MKVALVVGEATRSPSMRTPPVTTYSARSRVMKGTYSARIALARTAPVAAHDGPVAAGATTAWAGKWRSTGCRWARR